MSKQSISSPPGKGAHFTIEDRAKIEYGLNKGHSIRSIAKDLGKAPSSVSREIDRNCTPISEYANSCAKISFCKVHHACGDMTCNALCRARCISTCYENCPEFELFECERLKKSPHVCNACSNLNRKAQPCKRDRKVYRAIEAHTKYRDVLVGRRSGFDLTLAELVDLDNIVSPLLKKGQSPYHIVKTNTLPVSLSTLYRIVDSGDLAAGNIDLRQKLRRKPRKTERHGEKIAKRIQEAKVGHMYGDFLKYMDSHDTFHVEMDCVIGKRDEPPAILTLHYPGLQMQIAFYLPEHTAVNVISTLDSIEQLLGYELFCETFPVILTDNGSEFADVAGIERSSVNSGCKRTNVFYCEPNRSDQKASCENNHRLIRDVIPKSTSLVPYDQYDITLMMNHINSYCRKKSFGKCAYDLAMDVFPEEYFTLLGLYKIEPKEVFLKPQLLKEAYKAAKERDE
jgi:IS30 family transposase